MSEPLANELELGEYVDNLVDDYFDQMKNGASEDDIMDRINEDSAWSEHVIYTYKAKALVDMQWLWNTEEMDEAQEELGFDLGPQYIALAGVILRLRLEKRFRARLEDEKNPAYIAAKLRNQTK